MELFDEKARELNKLESDYSECKKKLDGANRRLVDSDYKGEYFWLNWKIDSLKRWHFKTLTYLKFETVDYLPYEATICNL